MCGCLHVSRRNLILAGMATFAIPQAVFAQSDQVEVIGGSVSVDGAKRQKFDASQFKVDIGNDGGVIRARDQIFYLDPETEAEFYRGESGLVAEIVIRTGGVLSLFGKQSGAGVNIKTTNAVGAIRGTTTYIAWQSDEARTYVCCCYGGVDLSNNGGGGKNLDTTYHTAVILPAGGGVEAAPYDKPLDHYDDDIVALEKEAGREPRWQLPNGQLNFFAPVAVPLNTS